jgi:hypothetical protein
LGKERKSLVAWKDGTMEYWNTGLAKKYFGLSTLFHHSTIPLFQNEPFGFKNLSDPIV